MWPILLSDGSRFLGFLNNSWISFPMDNKDPQETSCIPTNPQLILVIQCFYKEAEDMGRSVLIISHSEFCLQQSTFSTEKSTGQSICFSQELGGYCTQGLSIVCRRHRQHIHLKTYKIVRCLLYTSESHKFLLTALYITRTLPSVWFFSVNIIEMLTANIINFFSINWDIIKIFSGYASIWQLFTFLNQLSKGFAVATIIWQYVGASMQ